MTDPRGELVLVLDGQDLDLLADFWCLALGYRREGKVVEPYLTLVPESGAGLTLLLQRVPEPKQGKNRLHLDLRVSDLDAGTARLTAAGATVLTEEPHREHGWTWHVLADPEGNELCVIQPPGDQPSG